MPGCIDIRNISFGFPGSENPIFSDVNLSISSGEVLCLLGPNGCGKSTLIKCMSGILRPNTGSVLLDGENIRSLSARDVSQRLGVVPQSLSSAFPFKVQDIVVMGRASRIGIIASPSKEDMAVADHAMKKIGVFHLKDRPCNQISGGEWQLVLIARALTQLPHILLLDEPTSHLDMGNQIKILDVVNQLTKEGITIVMASHFPDHAFLTAGKVGILKNRRMTAIGTPDAVVTEKNMRDAYGIDIKIVPAGNGVNRKICIPMLSGETINERKY